MQWNCKGLRTRTEDLKMLLNEHNPGVISLQETKLGNNLYNPGLNYDMYRKNPRDNDHPHGGVAIIISKALQHTNIALNTDLQAVAIRVCFEREITICSLYLPPRSSFTLNDVQALVNQLPPPFLVLGDFNSHSPLWGGNVLDNEGRIIDDLIQNNAITLLNDGSMTYHNIYNNSFSAIDLSLSSSNIHLDFNWSVDSHLHGSDHFPIHLKYARNVPSDSPIKWKENEADWAKFQHGINLTQEFESFDSHLEAYDYWASSILNSAESSIPKTKGKPRRPAVPWWDSTCGKLRRITRKCYTRFKTSPSATTKTIYQRAVAKQRKYIRKAKRESWLCYINGINSKTPQRLVWQKVRKLSGKFVPSPTPSLKIDNVLISKPDDVAEKFGKHFSDISSSRNYSPHFNNIRNSSVSITFESDNTEPYNVEFTLRELREALSSSDSTAPGGDNITYGMLKNLPDHAKSYLLKILNKVWETGIMPPSWKIAIVIPVKKTK